MAASQAPVRLFLDAGVLVDGFFNRWGTCKGVLILAAVRMRFRAVVADSIRAEVERAIEKKTAPLPEAEVTLIRAGVQGWFQRARPAGLPWPSREDLLAHRDLLPLIRHVNVMPSVVSAVLARPDWVLSTNTDHWNDDLAARTGLRIITPVHLLSSLAPADV